jgi:DNA-binding transcriptional regulator YhcF (GntR family)
VSGPARIAVDTGSGVAPWRQIHDQVEMLVAAGALPPGAPLPTIRQLARDLGLAPGTVARAYRELEAAGVLHTARRHGTVVAAVPRQHRPDPLRRAAAEFAARAKALGVPLDGALDAIRDQF